MKLKKDFIRRLWRTIIEFNLLAPEDRVLVGLSGGKDSSFLTYSLAVLQRSAPFRFDLAALHVDQGFESNIDVMPMEQLCRGAEIPFYIKRTQIYQAAFGQDQQSPCARCSYLRRAHISDFAWQEGYNKVALAHHLDDAVETFLMSILYSGQIKTFKPKSYLDRTGVTVIRPLVYFREKEILFAGRKLGLPDLESPCPLSGKSMRAVVKAMLADLSRENKHVWVNLVAAMRENSVTERWPAKVKNEELRTKTAEFWRSRQEN